MTVVSGEGGRGEGARGESTERDTRLDEILVFHEREREAGRPMELEELIALYPEYARDLREFFANKRLLARLSGRLELELGPGPRLPADRSFGPYELIEVIGYGGMGVVYRAIHKPLDRPVALKILHAQGALADPTVAGRFRREAELAARLSHRNIVDVLDYGEHDGQQYLAMKLAEGGSLAERASAFSGNPRTTAKLVARIARAVSHAHERGVLHRDLKPSNVLLDEEDEPLLADFGLAGLLDGESNLTCSAVLGTPRYLAPEQLDEKANKVSPAVDVYGVGVILYELLVGTPPFPGGSSAEVLQRVVSEDPVRPSKLFPSVAHDLDTICMKCLEKQPTRRYASAMELADDLECFLAGRPIRARRASLLERGWKWSRRRPAAASLIAVSVAAVLTVLSVNAWYTTRLRETADQLRVAAATGERLLYAARMRNAWEDLYSQRPEETIGALEAYTEKPELRGFEWQYLVRSLNRAQWSLPRPDKILTELQFSPGGHLLAVASDMGVQLLNLRTREVVARWTQTETVASIAFSLEGDLLAAGNHDGTVRLWDVSTRTLVALLTGHSGNVRSVVFSPVGGLLATASTDGAVRLWDLPSGRQRGELQPGLGPLYTLAFSPDGNLLAIGGSENGSLKLWNMSANKARVEPRFRTDHGPVASLAFSPDGSALYVRDDLENEGAVWCWDTSDFSDPQLLCKPASRFTLSPDGDALAVLAEQTLSLWDGARRTERFSAVLRGGTNIRCVAFAPDGRSLTAGCGNNLSFWDANTPANPEDLTAHADTVQQVAFLRGGRHLVTASKDLPFQAWRIEQARLGPRVEAVATDPSLGTVEHATSSKDGSTAALADRHATVTILKPRVSEDGMTLDVDGKTGKHTQGIQRLSLSAKGKVLAVATGPAVKIWRRQAGSESPTWRETLHVSPSDSLIEILGPIEFVACSPDGTNFLAGWSDRGHLLAWDALRGEERPGLSHTGNIRAVSFSSDSEFVAVGTDDGSFTVWKHTPERFVRWTRRTTHGAAVEALEFSADNGTLVTGGQGGLVKLWELIPTAQDSVAAEKGTLTGHRLPVTALAFAPDGRMLVSAAGRPGAPGELKVWRAAREEEVARWERR